MTSAITPQVISYSYLNQIQGVNNTTTPPATAPAKVTPVVTTQTPNTADTQSQAADTVSKLLGGAGGGFSTAILSLLQSNSNGSFDPVGTLLGGTSTNNKFTPILTNLYNSVSDAVITKAKNTAIVPSSNKPNITNGSGLIDNLIQQQLTASVAYNTNNLQAGLKVINTNSYQADGITPIVV